MSNSKNDLLTAMDGQSITLGWNTIVVYNRDQINALFIQQFAQKTAAGNNLVVPDQEIPDNHSSSASDVYLSSSDLALGPPLLSFTNANLDTSMAALTMQFLSGYFFSIAESETAPSTICRYDGVLPDSNFNLTATLDLSKTEGNISDAGDVYLDLSQASAADISVNLVDGQSNIAQLSTYFQQLFAQASDEQKRYLLGSLANVDSSNPLNPTQFALRTQPAPTASSNLSDKSYGDGAVVLFVQTEASAGGTTGSLPSSGSGFPYLIPDDADSEGNALYSGAVIVESATLFDDIIKPAYLTQIGSDDVVLETKLLDNGTSFPASYLAATSGHISGGTLNESWQFYEEQPAPAPTADITVTVHTSDTDKNTKPVRLDITGMTVKPSAQSIKLSWPGKFDQFLYQLHEQTYPNDFKDVTNQTISITYPVSSTSTPSVDPGSNIVKVTSTQSSTSITLGSYPWCSEIDDAEYRDQITQDLSGNTYSAIEKLASLRIPDIDVFTLSNVLFPNGNALQLSDAAIPGDMALFGRINPSATTCLLSPLQATVVASNPAQSSLVNDTQVFTLTGPAGASISWSLSNNADICTDDRIEGRDDGISAIYKAPDISLLSSASFQEVITAVAVVDNADGTTSTYTASAVAIVSANPINVNPCFAYAIAGSSTPITFTASVVNKSAEDAGQPAWSGASDTTPDSAPPGVYTASYTPTLSTGVYGLETVTFSMGSVSTTANVLVVKQDIYPTLHVGAGTWHAGDTDPDEVVAGNLTPLAPGASRQLAAIQTNMMTGESTDIASTPGCTWSILGAPLPDDGSLGTLSTTGLYTAPALAKTTCVAIMIIDASGDFGYTVIPLLPGKAAA
ncbi:hypothetical protein [Microvirgula aerodenitrificans]|uniref:hypothetical protein n=1 Tax=Microvirgula aerodenitrificans TaxID=57480 RepID=UPI0028E41C38|nr:hypothetical protein [Microvirgula aerodenitrificans]